MLIEPCLVEAKTNSNVVQIVDDKSENANKKLAAFDSLKLHVEYHQDGQAEHKVAHVRKTGLVKVLKLGEALSSYDVAALPLQVRTVRMLLPKYNYVQSAALAFGDVGLRIWYLQCWQLGTSKKLNKNLFLYIATFLAPLMNNESAGLYEKFSFNVFRNFLIQDLKRPHVGLISWAISFFSNNEKEKINKITQAKTALVGKCLQTHTLSNMNVLLEKEMKEGYQGEGYQHLITRHQKLMTRLSLFSQNKKEEKGKEKEENRDRKVKEFNADNTQFNDNYLSLIEMHQYAGI